MLGILIVVLILAINQLVIARASPYVFDDPGELPHTKVAVLLGTSRYLTSGEENLYFKYRMDAAAELYRLSIVEHILVSGDNGTQAYNEPVAMRKALVERGIPEEDITLDYAGFRTLDSMLRAWKIFGQKKFIVVSQRFHNHRAVYIARNKGIDAVGYNARDVKQTAGIKTRAREYLARVKMMLDLYLLHTEPKYYGEEEKIG